MFRLGPDVAERDARRFLQHLAQRPGKDELAGTGHAGRLHEHDLAARLGPHQPGGRAHAGRAAGRVVPVARRPQQGGGHGLVHLQRVRRQGVRTHGLAPARVPARVQAQPGQLAAQPGQFALQPAHARLAGVVVDDPRKGRPAHPRIGRGQAVFAQLAGQQEAGGDIQLVRLCIAVEFHHLHTVQQGAAQPLHPVGRGDEQHLRKVEGDFQIAVHEAAVLLRVQHFQQGHGRVALGVLSHLVDLVQHEHRVAHPRGAQGLDDPPRHGPHVGAPVAAQFRLVAQVGQGHAVEAPPQRFGHGPPHRGLAHAGRPGEAQHRRARRKALRAPGQSLAHGGAQFRDVDGLGQILHRAGLQGLHGGVHRGVAGHHHDARVRGRAPRRLHQLHAVHAVHLQVGDDAVVPAVRQAGQRLFAIGRRVHGVPFARQHVGHVVAGDGLVVHHQHGGGLGGAQHARGQVFQHPFAHLAEARVAGVEHRRRARKVQAVAGQRVPRQVQQAFHVVEGDGVFRGGRVGLFHAADFRLQRPAHRVGQVRRRAPGAQAGGVRHARLARLAAPLPRRAKRFRGGVPTLPSKEDHARLLAFPLGLTGIAVAE